MPEQKFDDVLKDLKNKIYYPVYLLAGNEAFFIDELTNFIDDNILNSMEKEFNQTIVYGLDSNVFDLISMARRFPMMANHQVLIVREAQHLKESDKLAEYLKNPLKSTILVLAYKHKSLDKRTKLYKQAKEKGVVFNSLRLWDNQVPIWIEKRISSLGYTIDFRESFILAEYLGADLAKIDNELKKMCLNISPGSRITDTLIEENVGISKDYNVFELLQALIKRDVMKANRIVNYFAANPKENSIFMVLPVMHNFFFRTMVLSQLKNKEPREIAAKLSIKPSLVGQYQQALGQYRVMKLASIIEEIKNYDLKAKGLGNVNASQGELLRELTYKILHD
ncbi:MAG: DNA polymerase III subunit delta [Bacteroidales bacterium]|jgi:DNA polymerase-3 subunit delta|nr:DNA polymerase III subunit delta [Bacteroidales bacterium]